MSRSRSKKPGGRVPAPIRRMGTETIADRRTRGVRQRGQSERAEIEAELEADGVSDPYAMMGFDEGDDDEDED